LPFVHFRLSHSQNGLCHRLGSRSSCLTADVRTTVRNALETHLRHQPEKTSRSRIKRLRGLRRPQYRLRVNEVRVFYDVRGSTVEILAIVTKSKAERWLAKFGDPE
jgi:mRNA interferase RelE/StbE